MSSPLRILLIDDDEHTFVITRELLTSISGRAVELDWASEAADGLAGILSGQHDLYLLDYRLGPDDGIEVLSKARDAGCRAPIIILTGQADPAIDQRALESGATDYIAKDVYDVTRLEHSIRYAIERQALLRDLERERYLLHSLLKSLPDNVYFKDRESRFLRVSHAMANWVGLDNPDDMVGKTDHDFFAEEHATPALEDERRLMESGQPILDKEERETWPDGHTTWVSTSKLPMFDNEQNVVGTFGISRDITERKEAEIALRRSERLNRLIVDTALDAFIAMDDECTIIDWNPQAELTFGWHREEALGQSVPDLLLPENDRVEFDADLQRFLRTGKSNMLKRRLERVALHRTGREFPMEITISPIRQGDSYIFSAFIHDITNRKEAERQLRESKEAAEAANRAKSDFLANMSHEIRTPMNAVLGMTELVLDQELAPSQREYLTMVHDSGESLLALINDILDFSKIEAGKFELDTTPFHLRDTLGDTLKSLAVRAQREELELACHIDPTVPDDLIGDGSRLRQIIVNLVGNAIKFTELGEVVLHVDVEDQSDHRVLLHFAVMDTGIGIAPPKLRRVFQAFEQADTSTTRRYGGTGLGLTICSRLVSMMQGTIWAESDLGSGSTFHFTAQFTVSDQPVEKPRPRIVQGSRVLVVDDNATNRMILDEMLANWQMEVTTVAGVDAALEQLRAARASGRPFELVLSDVNMPGRDGFDLAAALRDDEQLADAVILMLTSAERPGEVQRSRDLGVNSYLHKPVKQSELYDAIVAALSVDGVEESVGASGNAESDVQLPKLHILLVEDSVVNQRLALALLNRWGHEVTIASNGLEALELVGQREYQLVLMDIQMPEMDGLEATRRIRESEQESGGHLPIIAMTAHAMKGDRELCLEAGMDDYVSKPVRAWRLLEAMAGQVPAEPGQIIVTQDPPESSDDAIESESPMDATIPYAVDWPVSIKIVQGDLDLLRDVIDAFKEESGIVLGGLRKALVEEDQKTAQRMAHTIKASFRTFGIDDAYDLAYECEVASREGRLDDVQSRLSELEKATRVVEEQFQSFVDTGRIPG
jgi:PAS domain S-box-containing protein